MLFVENRKSVVQIHHQAPSASNRNLIGIRLFQSHKALIGESVLLADNMFFQSRSCDRLFVFVTSHFGLEIEQVGDFALTPKVCRLTYTSSDRTCVA